MLQFRGGCSGGGGGCRMWPWFTRMQWAAGCVGVVYFRWTGEGGSGAKLWSRTRGREGVCDVTSRRARGRWGVVWARMGIRAVGGTAAETDVLLTQSILVVLRKRRVLSSRSVFLDSPQSTSQHAKTGESGVVQQKHSLYV